MDIRRQEDEHTIELVISGELTIFCAAEFHGVLQAALSGNRALRLHLGGVTEVDASALQLLLAAKRSAAAHGQGFSLHGHSDAVLEAMDLMQISPVFGDPVVVPAQTSRHAAAAN